MLAGSESSKFRACSSNIYDPNIAGALGGIVNSVAGANQGALEIQRVNSITLQATAGGFGGGTLSLNASKISSLYQAIDEVRVNALFGLNLIKAF